jgi:hypothetical protein
MSHGNSENGIPPDIGRFVRLHMDDAMLLSEHRNITNAVV